jgi:excisionase family DNA binding protein
MQQETRDAALRIEELNERLGRIENLLEALQAPKREKHFYTTKEAAERLDLSNWYVRKLCADGVILAEKHPESGRFLIAADEINRIETRRGALDE